MAEDKTKSSTQEKFKVECSKFMDKVFAENNVKFEADVRKDIYHYVELLGVERLSEKVTDEEVGSQLKEVISNDNSIEQIKNWVIAYAVEEARKRAQQAPKHKTAQSEGSKKDKVPQIYATTKSEQQKKAKPQEKEKPKKEPETKEKAKEPREIPSKDKVKLTDRIQDQEPPTKKRVKTDATNEQGGMDVEDKGEQQQPAQTDGKTKCKFFPFCKKENCPFFHPTEKCTYWPRCKFKQACMNAHEPCKFEDKCTRPNCYYDHPYKSIDYCYIESNPTMDLMKMLAASFGPQKRPFSKKRTLSNEVKDAPAGGEAPKEQPQQP